MIIRLQLTPAVHYGFSKPNNALCIIMKSNTVEKYVSPFDGDVYIEN
jgi:hypothetical protein